MSERQREYSHSANWERSDSPEVYEGCLLSLMAAAVRGTDGARETMTDMAVPLGGGAAGFVCQKAGCELLIEDGVLWGASSCHEVASGERDVPVELR